MCGVHVVHDMGVMAIEVRPNGIVIRLELEQDSTVEISSRGPSELERGPTRGSFPVHRHSDLNLEVEQRAPSSFLPWPSPRLPTPY